MKIEKLSERQIRCILDKNDLADRHIKVSELAYGTEKAKELFREMIKQASYEFGFDADNIPLMIEAIPVSSECIVLIITKVEDPEELDTRFSKFTPDDDYDNEYDTGDLEMLEDIPELDNELITPPTDGVIEDNGADDVINLFNKVREYLSKSVVPVENDSSAQSFIPLSESLSDVHSEPSSDNSIESSAIQLVRIFSFDTLDTIANAASIICDIYSDSNSLFKELESGRYYLILKKTLCTPATFNKVCNILTEFGKKEHMNYATENYMHEHYELIIADNAISTLSGL